MHILYIMQVAMMMAVLVCQDLHAVEGLKPTARLFKDDLNRTVEIPENPRRIVVVATADVEILFALGAGERLVGVPDGVRYPQAALDIDRVGGMYGNFNAEKIVEKEPDLMLFTMSNWNLYRSHLDRLEENNMTVLGFYYPETLDEIISHIKTIGATIGKEETSRLLCDDILSRIRKITKITDRLSPSQRPGVYIEWMNDYGGGTTTWGSKSRESNLIRMAGGTNIFNDMDRGSFIASNEELISRNPAIIILTANLKRHSFDELTAIIKARPGWKGTNAVRNNRIYIVEEQTTWANPRIVLGVETLARCIHPELFLYPQMEESNDGFQQQ